MTRVVAATAAMCALGLSPVLRLTTPFEGDTAASVCCYASSMVVVVAGAVSPPAATEEVACGSTLLISNVEMGSAVHIILRVRVAELE